MESRKTFCDWKPNEYVHQPVTPAEVLPEDGLVFFLLDLIPELNLVPIFASYERETRGALPFDVAMVVAFLFCSYSVGVSFRPNGNLSA